MADSHPSGPDADPNSADSDESAVGDETVTDDATDGRDGGSDASSDSDGGSNSDGTADSDVMADGDNDIDLTELTIKERIVLATAQQPAVALLVIILSLFAFTFLIALALVFPQVAGLFIIGTLLLVGLLIAVFAVLRRFDS